METKQPYQLASAIVAAMAFCFAAGAVSASGRTAASVKAENLAAEYLSVSPAEYFPAGYQNQATEIEALPAQF